MSNEIDVRASFDLTGEGFHPITPGVARLYLDVTTLDPSSSFGNAVPTNYYHVGLLRLGDSVGFGEVIAIIGGPQIIDVPNDITGFGYTIFAHGVVHVDEAGPPPPILTTSVSGGTISDGSPLTITFNRLLTPTPNDWLTVQKASDPLGTANRSFGSGGFVYTSSCATSVGTSATGEGACTANLNTPTVGESYEARWYANDTISLIARSAAFTVTS